MNMGCFQSEFGMMVLGFEVFFCSIFQNVHTVCRRTGAFKEAVDLM